MDGTPIKASIQFPVFIFTYSLFFFKFVYFSRNDVAAVSQKAQDFSKTDHESSPHTTSEWRQTWCKDDIVNKYCKVGDVDEVSPAEEGAPELVVMLNVVTDLNEIVQSFSEHSMAAFAVRYRPYKADVSQISVQPQTKHVAADVNHQELKE